MFIYYGKRFESEQVGGRVVGVQCDKCGCRYYYQLTRIGAGVANSSYGIGTASGPDRASERSEQELQERLSLEAELVPCPQCNWINDELVQGYRRGRYRRMAKVGLVIGVLGTVIGVLCGLIIGRNPADQGAVPYFLYGGPGLSLSFAAGMLGLRFWLRRRLRPNRNYPQSPALPAGTPPALLIDESSGKLRPAAPNLLPIGAISDCVDLQAGRHQLPLVCCECLQPTAPGQQYAIAASRLIAIGIPWCAECQKKSRRLSLRVFLIAAGLTVLALGAVYFLSGIDPSVFWTLSGFAVLVVIALPALVAISISAPVKVVSRDESRGVVKVRFRNADIARTIAKELSESTG